MEKLKRAKTQAQTQSIKAEETEVNGMMLNVLKMALQDIVTEGLEIEDEYVKVLHMYHSVYDSMGDEENMLKHAMMLALKFEAKTGSDKMKQQLLNDVETFKKNNRLSF